MVSHPKYLLGEETFADLILRVSNVKAKVFKKPQAKCTHSSKKSQSVIPGIKKGQTPCTIAQHQQNAVDLDELPNIKEERTPAPTPHGSQYSARAFNPDAAHDPRSPRKNLRLSFHSNAPSEAPLQLVPTGSSGYDIVEGNPMFWPSILTRTGLGDEVVTRPDSPTLSAIADDPVGELNPPLCPRRQSQIDLPTLTGRHVRSKSENWVLYDLDGEHEACSSDQ